MTDYDKLYRKDAKVCGEPFAEFVQFFMLAKPDDRLRVLNMAAQALRPGGHLLIADEPSNKKQLLDFFAAQGVPWQFTLDDKNFTFARLG